MEIGKHRAAAFGGDTQFGGQERIGSVGDGYCVKVILNVFLEL
jgi:hypothetical protein